MSWLQRPFGLWVYGPFNIGVFGLMDRGEEVKVAFSVLLLSGQQDSEILES